MNRVIIRDSFGKIIEDFIASDDAANNIVASDSLNVEIIKLTPRSAGNIEEDGGK